MKKICIIPILILLFTIKPEAQLRTRAFEINQRLARGINMGNMFEAPSETAWGNPWKPKYFRIISQLGFSHVRIPVRWEPPERSSASPPYTIYPAFLDRIQEVVDSALRNKLQPVINMHHHEALFADPDGQKERFLSQWKQIAARFKNYSDSLVFEILNEPNGNLTAEKWNVFLKDALAEIRTETPTRIVMIGTPEWGGASSVSKLQLPDDDNIILTVHYYNPFQFTHQGAEWSTGSDAWLGTKWLDTDAERAVVEQEFAPVIQYSQEKKIPVHIGEFGAYSKADLDSRVRWTTYLSRFFEQKNFSWAYWEFSAGFGIYNPATKQFLAPLVNSLLYNPMPQPGTFVGVEIFRSTFSSGTEGWVLSNQSGGSGSLSASGGNLIINITSGGSQSWHVQLNKTQVSLQQDKTYRISFRAMAESIRPMTVYAGMNHDPWSAYSGYTGVQLGTAIQEYSFIFNMKSNDPSARITFDLGNSAYDVIIDEIKLEELTFQTGISETEKAGLTVYPNPFKNHLIVDQCTGFEMVRVYSLSGQLIIQQEVSTDRVEINTSLMAPGIFLVSITGKKPPIEMRLIKVR